MGITQEYRGQVEDLEESMDAKIAGEDALSLKRGLDSVLPFIFLLLGFIVLFGFVVPVSQRVAIWVTWANYVVIAYFGVRLAVEYRLSNSNDQFLREHWLDLLMVIPVFSLFEEFKLAQLMEQSVLARFAPEMAASSAAFRSTTVAARMTKIARMLKRSIGF